MRCDYCDKPSVKTYACEGNKFDRPSQLSVCADHEREHGSLIWGEADHHTAYEILTVTRKPDETDV